MVGFFGLIIAHEDSDGDGILDDGDYSGFVGDNPCLGGATQLCDDNCPSMIKYANQEDVDSNGVGDACEGAITDCDRTHISGLLG